jgi:nucleotide-binding universal stress UspA family protein
MKAVSARARVQLQNVLFATDFSPAAAAAIPYVKEIATRYGAALFAWHVRPPIVNPLSPPASWASTVEAGRLEEQKQRDALLGAFPEMHPEIIIEEGDIQTHLASAIVKHRIDLLVIGTRGRTGVGKFFLGSTAEELFRQASCPVLTVGPHATLPLRDGRLPAILYATDFSDKSLAAASYATSLAQEFQGRLVLLHVIPGPKPGELVTSAQTRGSSEQLLQELVPTETDSCCESECIVEVGETADKILQVAKEKKAAVIVLGVRPETGFPGAATHLPIATAHKVVSHAQCPVLTVRG